MALKDLLGKAKQVATAAGQKVTEYADKTIKEYEAAKQKKNDTLTALPPLPSYDCPYGGCFITTNCIADCMMAELFCSCPQEQKCPEGKKYDFLHHTTYMDHEKLRMKHRYFNMRYTDSNGGKIASLEEAVMDYAEKFFPNLAKPEFESILEIIEDELQYGYGFDDTTEWRLLTYFNQRGNVTVQESTNIKIFLDEATSMDDGKYRDAIDRLVEHFLDLLVRDPDFFKWENSDEFLYAIKILCICVDLDMCEKLGITPSPQLFVDLFDNDGHIKPAGLGGPDVGETGDTLWNTLTRWTSEPAEAKMCSLNSALLNNTDEEE